MLDILIRNAQVIDGSGTVRFPATVAVEGGRIAAVGALEAEEAPLILDATGCVVTPGFVDMHSHADFSLPILPTADSLVHQGITSAVVGQCGASPAPLLLATREEVVASQDSADAPLPWDRWSSFGSYLDYLAELGTSINVVPLVGQGMVRAAVMGFAAGPATRGQIAAMQAEVAGAMDEGAIGLSTGLIYPPGSYAATEELIAVTRPVGERGGYYFSHVRGEGATLLEAVAEAIRIGRETDCAVQVSHFKAAHPRNWPKSAQALELIDRARDEGLDVTADLYPYLAGSTTLTAVLPEWAQQGGKTATLERLADAETRRCLEREMAAAEGVAGDRWDRVLISSSPHNREYEGHYIADLAAEAGRPAREWIFDALLQAGLQIEMITFGMSEENREQELRYPDMMIGTDGYAFSTEGPLSRGKPHPRSYGTFPRVLGHYVRERAVLSLEDAVYRMTGLPARKLRWPDRGLLRPGYRADLVVFDPEAVADRATFQEPHQYPAGIHHVLVNGAPVIRNGTHTGARPGVILRRV